MTYQEIQQILKPLGYALHRGDYGYFLRDAIKGGAIAMTFDSLDDIKRWVRQIYG
ncbi:hypothetical protein OLK001_26690 [Synechocystis sp. LKSZ1]